MSEPARVFLRGESIPVEIGTRLSDLQGTVLPCGGHGKCGKCKIKASGALSELSEDEKRILTEEEIASGVRLACRTTLLGDAVIEPITRSGSDSVLTEGMISSRTNARDLRGLGIAIDIGTTTLAAKLFGEDGTLLAEAGILNPQTAYGADVISRIEASLHGKTDELAKAVADGIDGMVETLLAEAGRTPREIGGATVTGNTAMLCLLTKTSVEPLSHAPFLIERAFGETLPAHEIGLSSFDAPVYLCPCISAFVGADTVCAILASDLCGEEGAMLADIGTNGEMALCSGGKLYVCSTAAGPAFEGVGISMGMRAGKGAIDRVTLKDGELSVRVIGGGQPVGICGSGLADAIASLLENGTIDETGYIEDDFVTLKEPVALTKQDVRMVQLAKSAISSGLLTLPHTAKIPLGSVTRLAVAGGFGNYLNVKSAARIGLLPKELAERCEAVGNAALDGAVLLLFDHALREKAENIAKNAVTVDLSSDRFFGETYIEGMLFPEE